MKRLITKSTIMTIILLVIALPQFTSFGMSAKAPAARDRLGSVGNAHTYPACGLGWQFHLGGR